MRSRTRSTSDRSRKQRGTSKAPTRRRLAFAPRPLHEQSFYLHVQSTKARDQLENVIMQLGGRTEGFLGNHVTCVLTDRPSDMRRTSPRLSRGRPASKGMTRAQAMVQKARTKPSSSRNDVIRTAQAMGLQIRTVTDFLDWAEKYKSKQGGESGGETRQVPRARALRGAFIKVEDRSRQYRPVFQEMRSWPRPNLDAPPGYGPYDDVTASRARPRPSSSEARQATKKRKTTPKKSGVNGVRGHAARSTSKPGYCEVCDENYRGVSKHLASKQHRAQATRSDKYSRLDKLIRNGRTLMQFVEKVKQRVKARKTPEQSADTPKTPQKPTQPRAVTPTPVTPPRVNPKRTVTPITLKRRQGGHYAVASKRGRDDNRAASGSSKRRRLTYEYHALHVLHSCL